MCLTFSLTSLWYLCCISLDLPEKCFNIEFCCPHSLELWSSDKHWSTFTCVRYGAPLTQLVLLSLPHDGHNKLSRSKSQVVWSQTTSQPKNSHALVTSPTQAYHHKRTNAFPLCIRERLNTRPYFRSEKPNCECAVCCTKYPPTPTSWSCSGSFSRRGRDG